MTCFMSPTSPADAAPSAAANYEPGGCQGKSASVPGSFPARQKFEGLLTWGSLQTFSFGAWCSTLCAQVLKSRTPFSEFVKTTLHVARGSTTASELAIFPLPVPKECQISFWWGLQNGPPQVMSPGSKNVGFPVSLQDFVGSVRVGQTNRKFTTKEGVFQAKRCGARERGQGEVLIRHFILL